jgi:hypothetical protein
MARSEPTVLGQPVHTIGAVQLVVVDTTAFYPWEVQRPPALERLFLGGRRYELCLCVPEVVIRETTRHFSRKINPAYNSFKDEYRAAKAAGTLPPELDIDFKRPPKADVVSAYERSLRNDIGNADGRVLPVPGVDHEWVLSRIFGPLKPSKPDEDSYRDILIWKTVVALVSEDPTKDVIFITKNTTDFARKGSTELHPELRDDLLAQGLRPESVVIVRTPEDYVQANLAAGDELRAELERLTIESGGAHDELVATLVQGLDGLPLTNVRLQLPAEGGLDDIHVESVNAVENIALVDVYEVGDEELVATLKVRANVDVYYAVTAPTGHDLEYAPRWAVDGEEAGAPFLMNTEMRDLEFDVDIEWNADTKAWGEVSILSGRQPETS